MTGRLDQIGKHFVPLLFHSNSRDQESELSSLAAKAAKRHTAASEDNVSDAGDDDEEIMMMTGW